MRGRGNNNRKGPNPLSRNYESNGPDVKIRGNAQHIAEKYAALARDAQASGDRVMAENYLQHAEHYNRIIMAAQASAPVPFQRDESFDDEMDDEDEGFEQQPVAAAPAPAPKPINGSGPQPVIEGTPAEVVFGEDGPEVQKQPTERRGPGRQRRPRPERPERPVEAERAPVEAKAEAEQPAVNGDAPHAVNGAANGSAANGATEEAAPVETRRPRRAPRPRRTAAVEANGEGESPKKAEAFSEAGSDA